VGGAGMSKCGRGRFVSQADGTKKVMMIDMFISEMHRKLPARNNDDLVNGSTDLLGF
jgi:hypothetical protein